MQDCVSRTLARPPDLLELTTRFPEELPFLLESSATGPLSRYSMLLFASDEELVKQPISGLTGPGKGQGFFDRLDSWFTELQVTAAVSSAIRADIPFVGGWFIYLGYEISDEIEPVLELPVNDSGLPDAFARRCPGAVIVFHEPGGDRAVLVAENQQVFDQLEHCINLLEIRQEKPEPLMESTTLEQIEVDPPEEFTTAVNRILEYLVEGDVFQVNVSREWSGCFNNPADPASVLTSLRANNPAPFSGLMRRGKQTLLSSSPERLVEIRGDLVQTRPIAGTRPRGLGGEEDAALHRELIGNDKERAEHIMLIDLERNDLGRVCVPGSIEVNELMVVESYAHVHHIVSNVKGRLRADASPTDVIKAVFPGGTITGCPKVRCMEIIAELETKSRGFYTGAMGYLGRDGQLDMNILIRSLLLDGPKFSFRCGAGIVADSNPERELVETQEKARGLLLALENL